MPFATHHDAQRYQQALTHILARPEIDAHEVAKQFIHRTLGVDGDDIVLAHFKDDAARAEGKPDSVQTLTDAVMDGFKDFQNHDTKTNSAADRIKEVNNAFAPSRMDLLGGLMFGGNSPTPIGFVDDLSHSTSVGDGLKKIGNFLWSRTLPGWIKNTFFGKDNVVEKVKEDLRSVDGAYGLFKNNGKGYSKENSYELKPSEVADKFAASTPFGELPYIKGLNKELDSAWKHTKDWPTVARYNFVEEARAARDSGELTPEQYRLVMRGGAPGVPLKGPVTFEQISKPMPPDPSVSVERFDINGYPSTNILRFKRADGKDVDGKKEVMYIPGIKPPFVTLRDKGEGIQWLKSQAADKDPAKQKDFTKREALLGHFSIYDRQEGTFHSGVEKGFDGLVDGSWAPSYLNYYDGQDRNKIRTDVFEDMHTQTDSRLRSDAKMQSRTAWEGWRDTINRASAAFGPVGGVIQVAVGVDTAINGKTYEERHGGVIDVGDGIIYTAADAPFITKPSARGHYNVHEASKSQITGGDARGSVASDANRNVKPVANQNQHA
ncbi:hypothetical protein GCM10010981_09540 [Dyella nitratireducens]|uniref:Dermonecrotic toxin N-terminal domain-containing protein n=1 Tax=Dyella nitratireducens TaxID=1849580 RepID=A0ABQ1FP64_9GAMM|nr:hypothetical protein GCM10010981_09540 [Dyella nitratireducens]GLQ43984.1 hypothetical protein GCM10007902_38340 [Dyella nitratireducens]